MILVALHGLSLLERHLVARLVERLRRGGFEMLLLRERLLALMADAAELAGDKAEAAEFRAQLEQRGHRDLKPDNVKE